MMRLVGSVRTAESTIAAAETEPSTVHGSVYRRLKADIVACELLPNARLRFDDLRKRYSVSVSSLREALSRLVIEGLVVEEIHKGVRVAPFRVEDLEDLVRVRRILEVETLRSSIEHGDARWEANILASFHMYEALLKGEEQVPYTHDERISRHQAFHTALVAACDSPRLLWLREIVLVQAQRYLMFAFRSVAVDQRIVLDEHERIMRATIGRRTALACALVEEHLVTAAQRAMPRIRDFTDQAKEISEADIRK
jgi:GntR family carbon starvation induced transcriptional regulator